MNKLIIYIYIDLCHPQLDSSEPDYKNNTLEISLHHLTNRASDKIIQELCEQINKTETIYPDTNLRLIVKLGSV